MDKDKKHIQDPLVSKEELENKGNLLIVKDLAKEKMERWKCIKRVNVLAM